MTFSPSNGFMASAANGNGKFLRGSMVAPDSAIALSDVLFQSSGASLLLKETLLTRITPPEARAVQLVERIRPKALRRFDQIPMRSLDMLCQVKLMAPYLAGRSVVFIGDYDCTSVLLALLGQAGCLPSPAHMLVLDFDERLLETVHSLAIRFRISDRLKVQLYNVFDQLPENLAGQFDWFYTNPPYGCRNNGESARLFVTRGLELVHSGGVGGCVIVPDDPVRPWTESAMAATQTFFAEHGWMVDEKFNQLHQYHLDDDRELASSTMLVRPALWRQSSWRGKRYFGRRVGFDEIPNFYGRSVRPPYPRYIRRDGSFAHTWSAVEDATI